MKDNATDESDLPQRDEFKEKDLSKMEKIDRMVGPKSELVKTQKN